MAGRRSVWTASAGLAICGEGDTNMDALLNRADAALYEAKRLGRNRLVGVEA
jgi:PleD family two-component response regulator